MPVTIQNLTDQTVFVPFTSGQTRYLAPHETIEDVAATEIKSNKKIEKLLDRRVIAITRQNKKASTKQSPRKKATEKSESS